MKRKEIDKDKTGEEATCKMCGKPIVFTGRYWEHTEGTGRHIAVPHRRADAKIAIAPKVAGGNALLLPAIAFREFDLERCCATCRFFRRSKSGEFWWCLRPNLKPFTTGAKNPHGCLCDGWYARLKDKR